MPVLALNSGRMWPNRPESCVEVVETRRWICPARARACERERSEAASAIRERRVSMRVLRLVVIQTSNSPARNARLAVSAGELKKCCGRRGLDHAAAVQQHDVAREPARLAEIVRRHHDLDAARGDRADDVLDRLGRGRIEARGRLVEKQDLRIARERARQREPLLLAAGQAARRAVARARRARPAPAVRRCAPRIARRAAARAHSAILAAGAAPEHGRPLEHDGAPRRRRLLAPPQVTRPAVGAISPMASAQQRGFARAVRADQTVGAPAANVSEDAIEDRHRAGAQRRRSSNTIGRSDDGCAHGHPATVRRPAARPRPAR